MKIFSILLVLLLLPVLAFADCKIAAICDKDGAQLSIDCDGFLYDNCNAELVVTEDGKVYNQIMCCSSEKDKCIYLLVPTDKIGT